MRNSNFFIVLAFATLIQSGALPAQTPAAWMPLAQSVDPSSPEVLAGTLDAAGLNITKNPCPSPTLFRWTRAALGIPVGGNLDAFADGTDTYPPTGYLPPPSTQGQKRVILVNFSVDRTTTGFGPIASEAATDGAAGDTFAVDLANSAGVAILTTDHQCLTPLPDQSNIDAICWNFAQTTTYPVYYSVDAATAAQMQGILPGVTEGDVITVAAPGAPVMVFISRAGLGLVPGDDIDALAYTEGYPQIIFSLSRTSPTAIANPVVGSAGLFSGFVGIGTAVVTPWAFAYQLGMNAGVLADNLDAVRIMIGDPWPWIQNGMAMPGTDSCNGVQLSTDRPVLGYPLTISVTAPLATASGVVATSVPNTNVTTIGSGCNLYLDPATGCVFYWFALAGGVSSTTLMVPNDAGLISASFRLQAGVFDPSLPGGLGLSNATTLIVGAY